MNLAIRLPDYGSEAIPKRPIELSALKLCQSWKVKSSGVAKIRPEEKAFCNLSHQVYCLLKYRIWLYALVV